LVTKRDRYDCIICGCRRGKSRDSVQYGDRVRGGVDDDYLLLPSRHSCRGWLSVTELSDKSQRCQAQLEHLALVSLNTSGKVNIPLRNGEDGISSNFRAEPHDDVCDAPYD
jgi:hypothetical protein